MSYRARAWVRCRCGDAEATVTRTPPSVAMAKAYDAALVRLAKTCRTPCPILEVQVRVLTDPPLDGPSARKGD